MTKQEFLAMSLPYGLKAQFDESNEKGCTKKVIGTIGCVYDDGSITCYDTVNATPDEFRMILHPLSDLAKEITHNGETFVPIVEINKRNEYIHVTNGRFCIGAPIIRYRYVDDMDELPSWITQYLVKLHFDIADLISKGEAIDVNTLDINPYK